MEIGKSFMGVTSLPLILFFPLSYGLTITASIMLNLVHLLPFLCSGTLITFLMEGEAQCTGTMRKGRTAVDNLSMLTSYCYIRYTCR